MNGQSSLTCIQTCTSSQRRVGTSCVDLCGPNERLVNGNCQCVYTHELYNGSCVPRCGDREMRNSNGVCEIQCGENQRVLNGACSCNYLYEAVPGSNPLSCRLACRAGQTRNSSGVCVSRCGINQVWAQGLGPCVCASGTENIGSTNAMNCVAVCGANQQRINGVCQNTPTAQASTCSASGAGATGYHWGCERYQRGQFGGSYNAGCHQTNQSSGNKWCVDCRINGSHSLCNQ